jgi:hypothetical protein
MKGLGRVFLVSVAAGAVCAGAAGANAGSNCDSYAKLSLQQARENLSRRCGFTGPRWSLEVNRHRQWCEEVGPAGWRSELKMRAQMLTRCKG